MIQHRIDTKNKVCIKLKLLEVCEGKYNRDVTIDPDNRVDDVVAIFELLGILNIPVSTNIISQSRSNI